MWQLCFRIRSKKMKFQILVDSASDLKDKYINDQEIGFKVVPLTILAGEKEFVDNENLNIDEMLSCMHACKKTTTACPAPQAFLDELSNAEYTFIVTITSKLSGSYNAACVARDSYEKPENVFVIDSKATSGVEILIVEKLVELINQGLSFENICKEICTFRDEKELFFILQRFDNLVANGRMSKIAGLIASALVLRPICVADQGQIKIAKKVIGTKNAFTKMIQMIGEKIKNMAEKVLIITHCKAENEANKIKEEIEQKYNFKEIRVQPMGGLCSYYALEKGIIVCG